MASLGGRKVRWQPTSQFFRELTLRPPFKQGVVDMRVLIVFESLFGNTRQIAEAIGKVLGVRARS